MPILLLLALTAVSRLRSDGAHCQQVLLQLDWEVGVQFAGVLQAVDQGFYETGGLCVQLAANPGTDDSVVQLVQDYDGLAIGSSIQTPCRQGPPLR